MYKTEFCKGRFLFTFLQPLLKTLKRAKARRRGIDTPRIAPERGLGANQWASKSLGSALCLPAIYYPRQCLASGEVKGKIQRIKGQVLLKVKRDTSILITIPLNVWRFLGYLRRGTENYWKYGTIWTTLPYPYASPPRSCNCIDRKVLYFSHYLISSFKFTAEIIAKVQDQFREVKMDIKTKKKLT